MLVAGLFCLGSSLLQIGRYEAFETLATTLPAASVLHEQAVLGRLDVARLGLSVVVFEGDTKENMARGAVHLGDTAALGSEGNAAIAGHRDSAFRLLSGIRLGDEISIRGSKQFAYRVTGTRIVSARDTSPLASDEQARLTLITCYPFHYVGSAPQRFIVEAALEKRQ